MSGDVYPECEMTQSLSAEIVSTIARFHLDQQGHEPRKVEVFTCGELIIVRCHDVFTPTERDLAVTSQGMKLIQSARRDQRALTRREIEREVGRVAGRNVLRSFYDIDTRNGEQVEVYVLDRPLP
jgi:uncharacterized protein YbcI